MKATRQASACLRTRFNGFDRLSLVEVADKPMPVTLEDA